MPLGGLIPYNGSPYKISIDVGDRQKGGQSGPQAPVSGPAAGMGSLQPPQGVTGGPAAPPQLGPLPIPPGGGLPPVFGGPAVPPGVGPPAQLPFIPGPPVGAPPGLPPGVGLPGPDPRQAGPALPQNIDWQALIPILMQLRGGGGPLGGGPLGA